MRLIASPHLSHEDADAIAQGLKQREEVVEAALVRELEQLEQLVNDRLGYLAWLLSRELLEIKLAVHQNPYQQGIYHEKLGILRDSDDQVVVFTGSANESASGLIANFECIDVFRSWRSGDDERIAEKMDDFQRLWQNQTPTLEILDFPEAARRSLLHLCPEPFPIIERSEFKSHEPQGGYSVPTAQPDFPSLYPVAPHWLHLRPYQQQAIANWFSNKGRGTLKMATGSGKTITALAIATRLYEEIHLQSLIIVCPYRHLVQQWARECRKFGIADPILAFESVSQWQERLSNQLYNVRAGNQPFLAVITTNATLITPGFQSQLPYFPQRTLIVGDEAHNLGAKQLEAKLPRSVGLRLALSATPERYFDERGTEALLNYFGAVLQPEFTLRDAIQQGGIGSLPLLPAFSGTDGDGERGLCRPDKQGWTGDRHWRG
jgi:hypothetical protein